MQDASSTALLCVQEWDILLAADFETPQTNVASIDWQHEKQRRSLDFRANSAQAPCQPLFCRSTAQH